MWVVIGITGLVLVLVLVPALGGLDPMLLLVAVLTVPVLLLLNRFFPPLFGHRAEELAEAHGRRSATVEELPSALPTLRGVGADRLMLARHHRTGPPRRSARPRCASGRPTRAASCCAA